MQSAKIENVRNWRSACETLQICNTFRLYTTFQKQNLQFTSRNWLKILCRHAEWINTLFREKIILHTSKKAGFIFFSKINKSCYNLFLQINSTFSWLSKKWGTFFDTGGHKGTPMWIFTTPMHVSVLGVPNVSFVRYFCFSSISIPKSC